MWFPLVHVHVVHGSPEIVGAANSICSERVSSFCRHCMVLCPLVSWWLLCRVRYAWAGGSIASAGWWLCMASDGYAGLLSGLSGLAM